MNTQSEPEPDDGRLFSRRQLGIIAGGGTFLLAGAAGTLAWTGSSTGTRRRATSFGTVEIRQAERRPRLAPLTGISPSAGIAGEHHHGMVSSPEPGNHTWADIVLVELEVRNLRQVPVLLSPGQLRLHVGPEQMSVAPNAAGRQAGALAAGATEHFTISFLTPAGVRQLSARFADPWECRQVALNMPPVLERPRSRARL